jgi:hypothetical protein
VPSFQQRPPGRSAHAGGDARVESVGDHVVGHAGQRGEAAQRPQQRQDTRRRARVQPAQQQLGQRQLIEADTLADDVSSASNTNNAVIRTLNALTVGGTGPSRPRCVPSRWNPGADRFGDR